MPEEAEQRTFVAEAAPSMTESSLQVAAVALAAIAERGLQKVATVEG
jgi:hypothetical protein